MNFTDFHGKLLKHFYDCNFTLEPTLISYKSIYFYFSYFRPPYWIHCSEFLSYESSFIISDVKNLKIPNITQF